MSEQRDQDKQEEIHSGLESSEGSIDVSVKAETEDEQNSNGTKSEKKEQTLAKDIKKDQEDTSDFWRELKEQQDQDELDDNDDDDDEEDKRLYSNQDYQQDSNSNNSWKDDNNNNSRHSNNRFKSRLHNNFNYNSPPLYLTPITEEIDHERMNGLLRDQNMRLTEQLKCLNLRLTDILSKQNKKTTSKQPTEQASKDISLVQKELENAHKKVDYLQKQNKFLNQKIQKLQPENLANLETQLKEKDLLVIKLQEEIKTQDNILKRNIVKTTSSSDLKTTESQQLKIEECEKIIQSLQQESRRLKSQQDVSSKQLIKKQEQIVNFTAKLKEQENNYNELDQKYKQQDQRLKQICEIIGFQWKQQYDIDDVKIANQFKTELSKLSTRQKSLQEAFEISSTVKNTNNIEVTEEKYQQLTKELQQFQQQSLQDSKEIKQLTIQIKESNSILKLKEKEISMMKQQLKIISETPRQITTEQNKSFLMPPMSMPCTPTPQTSLGVGGVLGPVRKVINIQEKKLFQIGQMLKIAQPIRGQSARDEERIIEALQTERKQQLSELQAIKLQKNRRREVLGNEDICTKLYNDKDMLKQQVDYRIVQVSVWTNGRCINGVQFFYSTDQSIDEIIPGYKMLVDTNNAFSRVDCQFNKNNSEQRSDGQDNINDKDKNILKKSEEIEYLKYIEVVFSSNESGNKSNSNNRIIEKLVMTSNKGTVHSLGNTNDRQQQQQQQSQPNRYQTDQNKPKTIKTLKYKINGYEYPSCVSGGLITFVDHQGVESSSALCSLGFEIVQTGDGKDIQKMPRLPSRSVSAQQLPRGFQCGQQLQIDGRDSKEENKENNCKNSNNLDIESSYNNNSKIMSIL